MNRENIQELISSLVFWRDRHNAVWDYNHNFFVDENGVQHGDIVLVYLADIVDLWDASKYVAEHGIDKVISQLADFLGMPLEHVYDLMQGPATGGKIKPTDLAITLHMYIFYDGAEAPIWSWRV